MRSPWRESPRRRLAWWVLIAAVVLAHALVGLRVASSVIGWNAGREPRHIEISFSRRLAPTAPPAVVAAAAPVRAPAPRPPRAVRAARAASAPASAASAPASAPSEPASAPQAVASAASAASAPEAAASAASSADATTLAGPQGPVFEWPPSTRLTYTLTGLYRGGPIYGKADIEWRRDGAHYQVQFDVHVSPFFDQHMLSDGRITDQGLQPENYNESFRVPLLAPRVQTMTFTGDEVVLPNGNRAVRLPQTQDQASQFVQFVWTFATRPDLMTPGTLVDFPLALNSGVRRWIYRVQGTENLTLPFGAIDTVHLVPVREGPRRPNEYPFEFWTAPTLQYLPVRVLVPLDEKNFADLSLDALPLQAAPAAGSIPRTLSNP